jgi:PAS domain S-box-containing protein
VTLFTRGPEKEADTRPNADPDKNTLWPGAGRIGTTAAMMMSDLSFAEANRLDKLRALFVLDTEPEPLFDSLARMAADICNTPIALITLIDVDRQWFKANVGLAGVNETPRDIAFCAHTIAGDALMEVPDALADPRFADNPLVTGEPNIRFYAGAPLVLPGGERLGSLCVIAREPGRLDAVQAKMLVALAAMAAQALAMRRDLIVRAMSVRSDSERAIAQSEAELSDLYANAPCGHYSLDAEGRFVRLNDTMLAWLGCTREEVIGRRALADFLTPDGGARFAESFDWLKRAGRMEGFECDLVGRSGTTRRLISTASVVQDADGGFAMTRTVSYDISELRDVRDALQRLASDQQSVIDTEMVSIFKLKDRHIVWTNRGAEHMFGYGPGEMPGMSTRPFHVDDDAYRHFGATAYPALAAGQVHRTQLQLRRKDGELLWIDMNSTAFPGSPGDTLCVMVDITELKRAEEIRLRTLELEAENRQLIEAGRVKGVFLSNMSHELYTPLNAIIGYAHVLGTGSVAQDSPRFARYVGDIAANGQHLLELIQSVLNFADVEAGKFEFRPRRVSLRSTLGNVMDIAQAAAEQKGLDVTLDVEPGLDEIVIDEMRFAQVVSIYVSNAVKFSHPGGRIEVRARAEDSGRFRIEVEDQGIGIAAADLPRLFTPFRQLSEGHKKAYPGAGLSLALTRRLVEAQGGSVAVRSREGLGSVFSFSLPRAQRSAAA